MGHRTANYGIVVSIYRPLGHPSEDRRLRKTVPAQGSSTESGPSEEPRLCRSLRARHIVRGYGLSFIADLFVIIRMK